MGMKLLVKKYWLCFVVIIVVSVIITSLNKKYWHINNMTHIMGVFGFLLGFFWDTITKKFK